MIPMITMLIDADTPHAVHNPLNSVHEWGVVVFQPNGPVICGSPWNEPAVFPDYGDAYAEAPVVWIHGEPFSGKFTVNAADGETITCVHPEPSILKDGIAVWEISTHHEVGERNIYNGPFAWAVEFWRNVPSLQLYFANTGTTDNFLYYECTVKPALTESLFHWDEKGNPVFTGSTVDNALFFTPHGVIPVAVQKDKFIPSDFPLGGKIDQGLISETFHNWADTKLNSLEITALWETWRPAFTEDNSYWLVFPIPQEYNNDISTVELTVPDHRAIEYNRLFLGAVRLNLQ